MKIAIYYDSLVAKGGAERVVILLANYLNADLFTSGLEPQIKEWTAINGKVVNIGNITMKLFRPLGILFEAPLRFLFMPRQVGYDLHIYMGFTSIFAAKKDQKNVWFCFTPNRLIYDMREIKLQESGFLKRLILNLHILLFQKKDKEIVTSRFKSVVAQSKTVQERVKKYYGIDSSIINSPLEASQYYFKEFGDFFLTVGRLFSEKRIDLIIDAFIKMPEKKLIVVGNGPDRQKIIDKIKHAKNIQLFSDINDDRLKELYATCLAAIYMPKDEDYGLVPLEANASGKVCIAVNEGGCRETVEDGKSGFLIKPNQNAIIDAVRKVSNKKVELMKDFAINHAKKFDISSVMFNWGKFLSKQLN